jgi:hypothetical protein
MGAATVNSAQAVKCGKEKRTLPHDSPFFVYGESDAGPSNAGRLLEVRGSSHHRARRFAAPRIIGWPLLPPESSSSSSRSIAPS